MSSDPTRSKWASGNWRPTPQKDQRPHAACENCYADLTTPLTGRRTLTFHCTNCGSEQTRPRDAAVTHGAWLGRLFFTSETQQQRHAR